MQQGHPGTKDQRLAGTADIAAIRAMEGCGGDGISPTARMDRGH